MGQAATIYDDFVTRLTATPLNLKEANDIFKDSDLPSTVRDDVFKLRFGPMVSNLDLPHVNKKLNFERDVIIELFNRVMNTSDGSREKAKYKKLLDSEEAIISSLMKNPPGAVTDVSDLDVSDIELVDGTDNWYKLTITLRVKYCLDVS